MDAVDALTTTLKDEEWLVRMGAAQALGALGDAHALKALYEAQQDDEWHVREAVYEALDRVRSLEEMNGSA